MSPIDEQLRTTLRQRAEDVNANGDPFTAIEHKARGIHRRRVAAGAAGALAVVVAAAVAIPAATGALRASRSNTYTNGNETVVTHPSPTQPTVKVGTPSTPAPVARNIEVYGDCAKPNFEPTSIRFACADNGDGVMNLHWTSWTSTSATAVGTYWLKDCKPNCAQGRINYTPEEHITLSDPQRDAHGQLVWTKLTMTPHPSWWDTGPLHGFVTLPTHQI